jgi:hypothetical protein
MTTKHIITSSMDEGRAKLLSRGLPGDWELRVTFDYRSSPLLEKYTCGVAQAGTHIAEYCTLDASSIHRYLTKSHLGITTFYSTQEEKAHRDMTKPTFVWCEGQRDIGEVLSMKLDESLVIQEISLIDPGQSYFLTCSIAPLVAFNGKEERVLHHFNTLEEPYRTRSEWMRVGAVGDGFEVGLLSHYGNKKDVAGLVAVELRPVKD